MLTLIINHIEGLICHWQFKLIINATSTYMGNMSLIAIISQHCNQNLSKSNPELLPHINNATSTYMVKYATSSSQAIRW